MIWHIAHKDFHLNLLSARFIAGCILCILIIPFSIVVNMEDYKKTMEVYRTEAAEAKDQLESTKVYSGLRPVILRPPNPMSIFCDGISGNIGNRVKIDFGNIAPLPSGSSAQGDNPFMNSFLSFDFAGIIAILISLLALIFSYDLFTREREDGTMKLGLCSGISRSGFLSGKIIGVIITLLPILTLCYLLSVFIILISPNIYLDAGQWTSVLLLFLISLVYMSVYIMAGAFISSRVKHSSTSIIISLLCWIWFVFLSPALARHVAESFVNIEKHDNVAYAIEEMDREFYEKLYRDIIPGISEDMNLNGRSWWNANGGEDGYFETSGTAREYMEKERRIMKENEPLRIDLADRKWIIIKARLDDLFRQKRLQKNLMLLSPTGMFEMLSAGLSRNDENAVDDFMQDVREYRETLISHFESNKWFGDFRYITAQPLDEILPIEENSRIRRSGEIPESWNNHKNPPLDLEGVPMFSYSEPGIPALLYQSLLIIILLILIGSILYFLTIRSFQSYDIR
jgi:ABC-type transport system involved in multi-copper enzyme maturation permease subunit